MDPDLAGALLTPEKNKVRNRSEGTYWDYKEALLLSEKPRIAELAKDIVAFHNTNGGAIIVGVTKDYSVPGVAASTVIDTNQLRDKIRYVGSLNVFQDSFQLPNKRFIWIIFVRKYAGCPR